MKTVFLLVCSIGLAFWTMSPRCFICHKITGINYAVTNAFGEVLGYSCEVCEKSFQPSNRASNRDGFPGRSAPDRLDEADGAIPSWENHRYEKSFELSLFDHEIGSVPESSSKRLHSNRDVRWLAEPELVGSRSDLTNDNGLLICQATPNIE